MEVQNKLTRCPNCSGYYDASVHASCPYCAGGASSFGATTAPNGASSFGETTSPNGTGYGSTGDPFGPTAPPSGGNYAGNMGGTIAVDPYHDGGNMADNMEPTQIGGIGSMGSADGGSMVDPVCGWLVCIDGPEKGVDFRVHNGYNYIGREIGDIHISNDLQISREKHAMIAYDADDNTFFFGPADGRNIIKLNGRSVFNAEEIHAYDVIKVGTTKLLFVPLCSEKFTWKQGEDKVD